MNLRQIEVPGDFRGRDMRGDKMNKRLAVSLLVLLALLVTQAYAGNNEESESIKQLRELGRRCLDFAQDNNGKLPPDLATLHYKAYVNRLKFFSSPATEKSLQSLLALMSFSAAANGVSSTGPVPSSRRGRRL